jgi:hypothetical protein
MIDDLLKKLRDANKEDEYSGVPDDVLAVIHNRFTAMLP